MTVSVEPSVSLEGGCVCGRLRYRLESAPIIVHGCHCRYCQQTNCSAFSVGVMIEADRVAMTGEDEPEIVHVPSALPAGQKLHRCPECLVAPFANHSLLGDDILIVSAGTLDEPWRVAPDVHCFTATKIPWVTLPEGVPAFEGDYESDDVWSVAAKARIEAVFSSAQAPG